MKHAELIARLEAAEVGSRELDAYVECASHGWNLVGWNAGWYLAEVGGAVQQMSPPLPCTTSLDAALALAERVLPGCRCIAERDHDGTGWACVRASEDSERFMTDAHTPALALCISILRALDA